MEALLTIRDLTVTVDQVEGQKTVLDGVSFEIPPLSIVGLVGGSGSGKTTTGLSILKLLPLALKIEKGEVLFQGENLLKVSSQRLCQLRGKDISMVFQEPLEALNPVLNMGCQIDEVLRFHTTLNFQERRKKILELLGSVGLSDPSRLMEEYPHRLSGGMRQRVMIAQAIAANPQLIIADEPTSNLDVTLQAKIMELFRQLRNEFKLSILLISHDLGMISHLADKIVVMAEGRVVEQGPTPEILKNPQHEYTQKLLTLV